MSNFYHRHPTTFVTMEINTHHPAIVNWSSKEKFELMKALRPNDLDMNLLLEKIPTKTRAEIEAAIKFYVSIAKHHPMLAPPPPTPTPPPPPPPPKPVKKDNKRKASALTESSTDTLRELEEELNEVMPTNDLVVETSAAIRMIAEYDTSSATEPGNAITYQQVINEIANVMQSNAAGPSTAAADNLQDEAVLDAAMRQILKNIKVPKRNSTSTASGTTSTFGSASGMGYSYSIVTSAEPMPSTSAAPMPSTSAAAMPSTSAEPMPSTSAEPMPSTSAAAMPSRPAAAMPAYIPQQVIRRNVGIQHNSTNMTDEH